MGIFVYLLFILASVHFSAAYQAIIPNDPKINDDPRYHCNTNVKEIGGLMNNETVRIKSECAQATCRDSKDIVITGCSPVGPPPGCQVLPGDMNKPYPDCCFIIKCE